MTGRAERDESKEAEDIFSRVFFNVTGTAVDIRTFRQVVMTLPFFSRVNIRHACKRLDALGFRTALAKINVADEMRKKKKYAPH